MRKEVWFGLSIMAAVVLAAFILLPPVAQMTNGHLGLLMLALVVVAIMLGFPTAFTLMGMGMLFAWIAYRSSNPALAVEQTLDLMVQRTYSVMSNDVLISIPLFVFMGLLLEQAGLLERLFRAVQLALARLQGGLGLLERGDVGGHAADRIRVSGFVQKREFAGQVVDGLPSLKGGFFGDNQAA